VALVSGLLIHTLYRFPEGNRFRKNFITVS
jgi:hypothetical protein